MKCGQCSVSPFDIVCTTNTKKPAFGSKLRMESRCTVPSYCSSSRAYTCTSRLQQLCHTVEQQCSEIGKSF